jgi:hypothetical protein
MSRKILIGVVVVIVAVGGWYLYKVSTHVSAQIDPSSLSSNLREKVISGTASGASAVQVKVVLAGRENSTDKWDTSFSDPNVLVTSGHWSITIPEADQACNDYDVNVYSKENVLLASGTFSSNVCGD